MGQFDAEMKVPTWSIVLDTHPGEAFTLRTICQEEDGTAKVYFRECPDDSLKVRVELLTAWLPLLNTSIARFNALGGLQLNLEDLI